MNLILSLCGAATVVLLVVHLLDYWTTGRSRPPIAPREDLAPLEGPPAQTAKPLTEPTAEYDQAA